MTDIPILFGLTDTLWTTIIAGVVTLGLALIAAFFKWLTNKMDELKTVVATKADEIKRTAIAASLTQAVVADKLYEAGVATNGPRLLSFMLETSQQALLIAELTKDEGWMDAAKEKLKEYRAQKAVQDGLKK